MPPESERRPGQGAPLEASGTGERTDRDSIAERGLDSKRRACSRGSFERVSKADPCPICGKPDWCLRATGSDGQISAVICPRVESTTRAGEAGWLHRLRDERDRGARRSCLRMSLDSGPSNAGRLERLVTSFQAAMNAKAWHAVVEELALPRRALERLGIGVAFGAGLRETGISGAVRAWVFPMGDAGGRLLGASLRLRSGKKLSIRGGHQGLFLPSGLACTGSRLFIAEGQTDTAALLELGFEAIGRPSSLGGVWLTIELIRRLKPAEVVVVADNDPAGRMGASRLARALVILHPDVRIIAPPVQFKDLREWTRAGAVAADVEAVLRPQVPLGVSVIVRPRGA